MRKDLKTIIADLTKRYRGDFIRDVRLNEDGTITYKVVRKDDTWREITE